MKPLDFVRTPAGGLAIITEISNNRRASISYLKEMNPGLEYNAWWDACDLVVIDSLPWLLARNLPRPFGDGKDQADIIFDVNSQTSKDGK